MKRFILAAAALAVPMLGVAVNAASIDPLHGYTGKVEMTLINQDVGRVYDPSLPAGTYTGSALQNAKDNSSVPPAGNPFPNEDGWGVFQITNIYNPATPGNFIYQAGDDGIDLVGIFWNETDIRLDLGSVGGETLEFVKGTGQRVAVFEVPHNSYTPSVGPSARTGDANTPIFPTVTVGNPIWTFFGVNFTGQNYSFFSNYNQTANTTVGGSALDVGAAGAYVGTQNDRFVAQAGPDVTLAFRGDNLQLSNPDWLLDSHDPVEATVVAVPTPSTAAMGLVGMAGMALGALRRRRTA